MQHKTLRYKILTLRKSQRRKSSLMHSFGGNIIFLSQDHFSNLIRLNKRKVDFVKNNVTVIEEKDLENVINNKEKKVILRFLLNPQ